MANQDDMGGHFVARSLSDEDAFDVGGQMAQTFSACIFSCLAIYMVLSNTKKLKDIQASSFEERLKTCCQINLVIATLSAFLNFFQLTEVRWQLPGASASKNTNSCQLLLNVYLHNTYTACVYIYIYILHIHVYGVCVLHT